ncbi:MAG: SDR family oxidoreductase [Elainellaceae cyanobacterium]
MQDSRENLKTDLNTVHRLVATAIASPTCQTLSETDSSDQHVLIVDDGSALVDELIERLRQHQIHPIILQGKDIERSAPIARVDIQDESSIEHAIARIRQIVGGLHGIVFLSTQSRSLDEDQWLVTSLQWLKVAVAIARGVSLTNNEPLDFLYFITAQGGRFGLDSEAAIDLLSPGIEALAHPLRMEMPKTRFRSIDLDPATPLLEQARQILEEFAQSDQPHRTAYGWKQGQRAALSVQEIAEPAATGCSLTDRSVVVFAGGARGIGAVCAKALAEQVGGTLVFLGRTPLDDEAQLLSRLSESERDAQAASFMTAYKDTHPGCSPKAPRQAWRKKMQAVEAIETLESVREVGANAEYQVVDVRDRNNVNTVLQQIKDHHGRIDAIVHVAGLGGVDTDRLLMRKDWSIINSVLETKVIGAIHLLQAAEAIGVGLFVGFGSIASRFGNSGQVDYASANGLLTGIVRAHNAKGVLPVARAIAWGAWDGVGIAVGGPTKAVLMAHGIRFIDPAVGAACFLQELRSHIGSTSPAEVYISPSWTGLSDLLKQQPPALQAPQPLMGSVVEQRHGDYLRAEHWLNPKEIPFLDHHRYDGTAWVPAVMGMEVAVQASARLFPHLTPFALREIALKKAVRLVRDEPVLLITEARFKEQVGAEWVVSVTVSAQFKQRTWVFAEMFVILSSDTDHIAQGLDDGDQYHALNPIEEEPGDLIHQTHADLYPSQWLRFQISGPTFQVIETLALNGQAGRTEGTFVSTAKLEGCYTPMTLIDGALQAYGVTLCSILQGWPGPPRLVGEIRWLPDAACVQQARFAIRTNLDDTLNYPVMHMFDTQDRCIIRMQRGDQGGTSLKELRQTTQYGSQSNPAAIATPYLGTIVDKKVGRSLRAEIVFDPATDVMLRDHQFHMFMIVPAVYFMEVAVEASTHLISSILPCELREFYIYQALHILKEPQTLIVQAEVNGAQQSHVQLFSYRKGEKRLHAEGLVVHDTSPVLGTLSSPQLTGGQIRTREMLYPHRFVHGPIFQVIETMELASNYESRAQLRVTQPIRPGAQLPMTLLDGAFQVDSATRSGFDRPSGLPRTFARLRWLPEIAQVEHVLCVASTQNESTHSPGECLFVDEQDRILLHMTGITLTSVLPSLGIRSKV